MNKNTIVEQQIKSNAMVSLYFSGVKCGACEIIKVKLCSIFEKYPLIKNIEIDGEKEIDIAAKYDVFSLPLLILYVDGKETFRVGRNINFLEVEEQIDRYYKMIF